MLVEEPALLLLSVDTTAVRVILEPYLVQSRRGGMHHFYNRHAMPVHPQGVMVIGVWAASAGPKDNNLEVRLYWDKVHGMLVQEMQNISGSKARSVARTASIEIETSDASTV